MGKCSGLKGGGHHRRALDVAEKKKNEKAARKKEQAASGKRALILKEILTNLDPDCDLYLDAAICDSQQQQSFIGAGDNNNSSSSNKKKQQQPNSEKVLPELCRKHFRHEACTNKRCRFQKEYSIAEALSNATSGTNRDDDDSGPLSLPALRYLPGVLRTTTNVANKKKTHQIIVRRQQRTTKDKDNHESTNTANTNTDNTDNTGSVFETALAQGSSVVETIVECLSSDVDVVALGTTCWHLCDQILVGERCSPSVQLRKYRAKHRKLHRRNQLLLSNKTLGGALRYAVGYFETTTKNKNNNSKRSNTKKNNNDKPSLRPVLMFDCENPNVYEAFRTRRYTNHFARRWAA